MEDKLQAFFQVVLAMPMSYLSQRMLAHGRRKLLR
jgi:hypothetical protein